MQNRNHDTFSEQIKSGISVYILILAHIYAYHSLDLRRIQESESRTEAICVLFMELRASRTYQNDSINIIIVREKESGALGDTI